MKMYSNAIHILENNLNIKQISHLLLNNFVCRKLHSVNWAVEEYQKYTHIPTSNLYQLPQCVMTHTHPYVGVKRSVQFQIIFLPLPHNNSQTAILLSLTSTSKLQVFFKVKYQIYYSIYIFLNQFTCVKLCYHFY